MKIKKGLTTALDRSIIKKSPKLAVPEKPSYTGYACTSEYLSLRMKIELDIKAIQLREDKYSHTYQRQPPAWMDKLLPIPSDDPVRDKSAANGDQYKRPLGHHRTGSQQGAGHQMSSRPYPRGFIKMIY